MVKTKSVAFSAGAEYKVCLTKGIREQSRLSSIHIDDSFPLVASLGKILTQCYLLLLTHQMFITAEIFIVLNSKHLVQIVNPASNIFLYISVTLGHEQSCRKNQPHKDFACLLVCIQNLSETA